jgi:peptide subunit release factor 1 (eRF1)
VIESGPSLRSPTARLMHLPCKNCKPHKRVLLIPVPAASMENVMSKASHLLDSHLERLADIEPTFMPVISLYLDTQPDQHGRDHFEPFVRKAFASQVEAYGLRTETRERFEEIAGRIRSYLRDEVKASTNSVVIFARGGDDSFFEPMQFDVPIDDGHLVVSSRAYLYPLARLRDQHDRYAALIVDTHSARLYVFELGKRLDSAEVESPKLSRTQAGGWSQARNQRHVDNVQLHHGKDVVEALDRLVREKQVERIVLAAERVIMPELRRQLPAALVDHVIEASGLDMHTSENDLMRVTSEIVHEEDAKEDRSEVARLLDERQSGGLGAVGANAVLAALDHGQVDQLLIAASLRDVDHNGDAGDESVTAFEAMIAENSEPTNPRQAWLANELVTKAVRTRARIRFIEDKALLASAGGVGGRLRYRLATG